MIDINISIDGQLHLRKLCERYLSEKEMVLLEWIRFSRLRNAQNINISLSPEQTIIIDDGQAISQSMWHSLKTLIISTDSEEIERSVEHLKPLRGLGALAPLASGSRDFTILSPSQQKMLVLTNGSQIPNKTIDRIENRVALVLGPRNINAEREKELLVYHLSLVEANVTINNEPLIHRQHSSETFLSLKLYQADLKVGSVSLPRIQNHSSLELCHGDIPWRIVHFPAKMGRIYWARLDSVLNEEELGPMAEQIEQANIRLLEYLRDHIEKMPESLRNRIEELLLEWSKPLAPDFPILNLPMFKLSGENTRLTLAQIQEKSRSGSLMATLSESDRFDKKNCANMLVLNRKQADFLSRSAGIYLNFTGSSQTYTMPFIPHYTNFIQRGYEKLDRLFASVFSKRTDDDSLIDQQKKLAQYLSTHPDWNQNPKLSGLQIIMLNYKGFWPSHHSPKKKTITIHANHVITRTLLNAIEENRSGSLFVKSLIPPEIA